MTRAPSSMTFISVSCVILATIAGCSDTSSELAESDDPAGPASVEASASTTGPQDSGGAAEDAATSLEGDSEPASESAAEQPAGVAMADETNEGDNAAATDETSAPPVADDQREGEAGQQDAPASPEPDPGPTMTDVGPAEPVEAWSELFNRAFRYGDFYFTGLPTEQGIRRAADEGVRMVISLLPDDQHAERVAFEEEGLAQQLGMTFEQIPIMPDTFSKSDVARFAEVLEQQEGAVLVHCASSNRCGGLWAAYLHLHQEVPIERAIELGKSAGLSRQSMIDAVKRVVGDDSAEQ